MYCHIKKGTIKVKNGEWIAKGDKIGLVGNSGRSAVPHLHFNIQRGAEPGSQTIKSNLLNYKQRKEKLCFNAYGIPEKNDIISALAPVNYLQDLLHLKVEDTSTFKVKYGNKEFIEKWSVEVDLLGRFFIKSDRKSSLEFSVYDGIFNVLDFKGNKQSALQALAILMSRLPLYQEEEGLEWTDLPPYSILLKPFWEDSLMLIQSLTNISNIKSKSKVFMENKTISVATQTELNIMGKKLKSYHGNIEIKDLIGIIKIELNIDDKNIMQVELLEEEK